MIQNVNKFPISTIFEINMSSACYKIPKYQREYTWSYNEWAALYNDIIDRTKRLVSQLMEMFRFSEKIFF